MSGKFKQMSLASQVTLAVTLLMVITGTLTMSVLTSRTATSLEAEAERNLDRQGAVIGQLVEFYYQDSLNNAERLSDIFFNMFPQGVRVDQNNRVKVKNYNSNALLDENGVVNGLFEKTDQFTRMTGGTATVFARHGDDFLRVSTSLKKQNGERAFGTLLGTGHPGYRMLMRGETYTGVAHLFGRDYMTVYRPLQKAGETIAILYIGFDLTTGLKALKAALTSIQVGDSGAAQVLAGKNHKQAGTLLMSSREEGRSLADFAVQGGSNPFADALAGNSGVVRYQNKTGGDEQLLSYRQIEGWNWVLLQGAPTVEFATVSISLRNMMVILAVLSAVLIIGVTGWQIFRMLRPLAGITTTLHAIGSGQLNASLEAPRGTAEMAEHSRNEISGLVLGVSGMRDNLLMLVSELKSASHSLDQSVDLVRDAGRATEVAVNDQALETDQVASAMEEMVATTQTVADDARHAAEQTRQGAERVEQGREAVQAVERSIGTLAGNMTRASELIIQVEGESENIGNFVSTISEVAEQTNLLALNAAIEAARAGETGRGFAVVADEVRALAGRTQQATSEIESIVGRLQEHIHQVVGVI